ncbi:MAG: hypothetical protein JWO33_1749 [Caulobacteraceae bacterium]|nr:hypothetical protein [Caulobacteraceae bacterium]
MNAHRPIRRHMLPLLAITLAAGVAHAEGVTTPPEAVLLRLAALPALASPISRGQPALDLAVRARDPKDVEAQALRAAGLARTAVDRRFASDDLTGSLGFLCGIEPGFKENGVTGSDPHGRFLGAKLSYGF